MVLGDNGLGVSQTKHSRVLTIVENGVDIRALTVSTQTCITCKF